MGNTVGKALKVDSNTRFASRGKSARICVELDLHKPLVPKICVDGKWQTIEYEGLNLVCFKCGRIDDPNKETDDIGGDFGPWMVVQNRRRRTFGKATSANAFDSKNHGSRFNVL
ncbi:hypothetical protein DITRI_Ditri06bG0158500 [Diplodiscus trichospermus]